MPNLVHSIHEQNSERPASENQYIELGHKYMARSTIWRLFYRSPAERRRKSFLVNIFYKARDPCAEDYIKPFLRFSHIPCHYFFGADIEQYIFVVDGDVGLALGHVRRNA